MRKIYVFLILLGFLAVAIFADSGWLNAQTEIQKSFNANSPGQNLQNQLLGSTNTNNTFLNLNGSNVSALSAGQSKGSTTSTTVTVSRTTTMPSYVATATAYDASFCGATGNPLIGQYQPASEEAGVLLAKLTVQSNMATIDVYVTPTFTGSSNLSTSLLKYYNNGSSWTSRPTMNLTGSNSLYTGELDVVVLPNPNYIPQWTQTGRNVLKIVFVVTPKISGF